MELFIFDSEKESSTDTRLGCNLIDGDPFGFAGPLETRTKVGHFGMQAGDVLILGCKKIIWIRYRQVNCFCLEFLLPYAPGPGEKL